jgi:tetratricopeptide (TPR) repeat protein
LSPAFGCIQFRGQDGLAFAAVLNKPDEALRDIAETLHNAGEAYANIGQYEQAMSNYMRAIDPGL